MQYSINYLKIYLPKLKIKQKVNIRIKRKKLTNKRKIKIKINKIKTNLIIKNFFNIKEIYNIFFF